MEKYHVYILYSTSLNRYYIGSTNNLDKRLSRHLFKSKGFTTKAKDWELKYSEELKTKSDVLKREIQIKKWKSRKMIEKLINSVA